MTDWLDPSRIPRDVEWLGTLVVASSVKSAVVLAAGAVAALAMRRGSAASRHLAWSVAVVGALGIPVLSATLPGWRISPAMPWPVPPEAATRPIPLPPSRPTAPAAAGSSSLRGDEVASIAPAASWQPGGPVGPLPSAGHRTDSFATRTRPSPHISEVLLSDHDLSSAWKNTWMLIPWAAGVFLSGVPVLLGLLSLRRLSRGATPVRDPAMLELMRRLAAQVGTRRPVRLVLSASREIPMTWGVFRPVILLPADAEGWPEERLTTALLHELAHVRRRDFSTQLAAQGACAIHWFNPLAWLALASIRREQEQAADDTALACGLDRYAYAGQLLAIVTGRVPGGSRTAMATSMASSAKLERRLVAILDAGRSRREPGRRAVGLVAAVAAGLILPLAAFNPWSEAQARVKPAIIAIEPQAQPPDGAAPAPRPKADGVAIESEVLAKVREAYVKPPDESALRRARSAGCSTRSTTRTPRTSTPGRWPT